MRVELGIPIAMVRPAIPAPTTMILSLCFASSGLSSGNMVLDSGADIFDLLSSAAFMFFTPKKLRENHAHGLRKRCIRPESGWMKMDLRTRKEVRAQTVACPARRRCLLCILVSLERDVSEEGAMEGPRTVTTSKEMAWPEGVLSHGKPRLYTSHQYPKLAGIQRPPFKHPLSTTKQTLNTESSPTHSSNPEELDTNCISSSTSPG